MSNVATLLPCMVTPALTTQRSGMRAYDHACMRIAPLMVAPSTEHQHLTPAWLRGYMAAWSHAGMVACIHAAMLLSRQQRTTNEAG